MIVHRFQFASLLLLLTLFSAGCQSDPIYGGLDRQPLLYADQSPRSLASNSERLNNLTAANPPTDLWYLDRRDRSPVVYSGYVSPRWEHSSTYVRDTLTVHGDHVHDRYSQTTYRHSFRRSVR